MKRTAIQSCVVLSLMWLIAGTESASAQLKPPLDEQLQHYTKTTALSGSITIVGSDTMKGLIQGWQNKMMDFYPQVKVQVQSIGSEAAPQALLEGKAQIAAMSRQMTAQEIASFTKRHGYEPAEIAVAEDGLAVFVHRDNPVSAMTLEELASVFCEEGRDPKGSVRTSWSQFDLTGEWAGASINLVGRNATSGTATFFREHVCRGGQLKKTMRVEPGSASVVVDIKNDRHAIGFSGVGYQISSIKPISLAQTKGAPFVEPTFERVTDGSYPLHRRLYFYINQEPKSAVPTALAEFVKLVVSHEGQQVVTKQGFFPLPTSELNQQYATWGRLPKTARMQQNVLERHE